MKQWLLIIFVIAFALFGFIAMAKDDRDWCMSGKVTLPCDSGLMKDNPFKVKIKDGDR